MKYKKKKIKLTKFGKIFFSLIGIFIISIFMLSINSFKHRFYKVEESDKYLIEINYPQVKNKSIIAYSKEYIKNM